MVTSKIDIPVTQSSLKTKRETRPLPGRQPRSAGEKRVRASDAVWKVSRQVVWTHVAKQRGPGGQECWSNAHLKVESQSKALDIGDSAGSTHHRKPTQGIPWFLHTVTAWKIKSIIMQKNNREIEKNTLNKINLLSWVPTFSLCLKTAKPRSRQTGTHERNPQAYIWEMSVSGTFWGLGY